MRLEMLAKDENSGRTGCPSVYIDENGWAVIQGPEAEPAVIPTLADLLPGETRVRISSEVLAAAAEALRTRRGVGTTLEEWRVRPSVFLGSDGYAVVQGPEIELETRASLVNLLPGETGVRISTEVLTAAVAVLEGR